MFLSRDMIQRVINMSTYCETIANIQKTAKTAIFSHRWFGETFIDDCFKVNSLLSNRK